MTLGCPQGWLATGVLIGLVIVLRPELAELADAVDSKSTGNIPYEFDSRALDITQLQRHNYNGDYAMRSYKVIG